MSAIVVFFCRSFARIGYQDLLIERVVQQVDAKWTPKQVSTVLFSAATLRVPLHVHMFDGMFLFSRVCSVFLFHVNWHIFDYQMAMPIIRQIKNHEYLIGSETIHFIYSFVTRNHREGP